MPPDTASDPGQELLADDMLDLLLEALDGEDLRRTALVMRAVFLRMDTTRDTDLDRLRQTPNHRVTQL